MRTLTAGAAVPALVLLAACSGTDEPDAPAGAETSTNDRSVDGNCPDGARRSAADFDVITDVRNERLQFAEFGTAADRTLVGPHVAIELERVASSECVTTGAGAVRAPEGSHWLTIEFTQIVNHFDDYPTDEAATISAYVDIDGVSARADRDLEDFLTWEGSGDQKYFAVAVPDQGEKVELVVSDSSVQQAIGLLDGNRTKEKAVYYEDRTEVGLPTQVSTGNLNPKTGVLDPEVSVSFAIRAATLSGWQPEIGAAPDGQVWLRIELDQLKTSGLTKVDWTRSLTVEETPAQGGVTAPARVPVQVIDENTYEGTVFVAVPVSETSRQATLFVQPELHNGTDVYTDPNQQSVDIQFE